MAARWLACFHFMMLVSLSLPCYAIWRLMIFFCTTHLCLEPRNVFVHGNAHSCMDASLLTTRWASFGMGIPSGRPNINRNPGSFLRAHHDMILEHFSAHSASGHCSLASCHWSRLKSSINHTGIPRDIKGVGPIKLLDKPSWHSIPVKEHQRTPF